jgi:transposase
VSDPKSDALRERQSLNPRPDRVRDEKFGVHPFFDPCDLVQVKYEMLRAVRADGESVVDVAKRFGFTRQTWYRAAWAFDAGGLPGLVPERPGPKNPRKLTPEIVGALLRARRRDPALTYRQLVDMVAERYGFSVHERSIQRAISRQKK